MKVAVAAAERLPLDLRRRLAEQLLAGSTPDAPIITVSLRRLSPAKRDRLATLMDKNNTGRLTRAEQREIDRLGREVDHLLLANSQALARSARPELFDERGRPVQSRLRQVLRERCYPVPGLQRSTLTRDRKRSPASRCTCQGTRGRPV